MGTTTNLQMVNTNNVVLANEESNTQVVAVQNLSRLNVDNNQSEPVSTQSNNNEVILSDGENNTAFENDENVPSSRLGTFTDYDTVYSDRDTVGIEDESNITVKANQPMNNTNNQTSNTSSTLRFSLPEEDKAIVNLQ